MKKKLVSRNEYFGLITKLGIKRVENEYDISPLALSKYNLNERTRLIANNNFMEETTTPSGNYMLKGHWSGDLCYQFASKCGFNLVQVDGYSSYAYSDEQMAVFIYCEGDITLIPFTDRICYEKEKNDTIKFYEEEY